MRCHLNSWKWVLYWILRSQFMVGVALSNLGQWQRQAKWTNECDSSAKTPYFLSSMTNNPAHQAHHSCKLIDDNVKYWCDGGPYYGPTARLFLISTHFVYTSISILITKIWAHSGSLVHYYVTSFIIFEHIHRNQIKEKLRCLQWLLYFYGLKIRKNK